MPKLSSKLTKKVFYPGDKKSFVEIKYIKPGRREWLDSESQEMVGGLDSKDEFSTTIKFNTTKKRKLFLVEVIDSWGGFLDEHGKETKPTAKNIQKFDDELPDFFTWLSKEHDDYVDFIEGEEKPAKENSKS